MNTKLKFLNKYSTLSVILVYFFIAIVFTYPLAVKIQSQIPEGRADVFQAVSNIDSRVQILADTSGTYDKFVFLGKNINTFLPYVLLNLVFNKNFAYNFYFLFSFFASALGMYLLAMYFTKNKWASFLAGIIFAFAPFHFYEATVVNIGTMHQEWLPFFVLYLFKFFEKFELKHFVGTICFAFLITMTEHQFLAFTVLFVGVFFIFKIVEDKSILRSKKLWGYIAISFGMLIAAAFLFFGKMLKVATSENNFLDPGINAANKYSMGVLEPFLPAPFHAFWPGVNNFFQDIMPGYFDGRGSYFIGFSVLGVVIFLFFSLLKGKNFKTDIQANWRKISNVYFWTIATAIFYFFSMGPSFSVGKVTIYLPYFLVYKFLPFYENIRTTGRMFVFVLMGVSILFAYGYVYLSKRYEKKKLFLTFGFTILILLEFWVAPVKTMAISHSSFYDKIAKDQQVYALLEIPGSTDYGFASYALYTETVHKKQVLNGMPLARKISKQFEMQQEAPIIKQLLYTIPKGNDPEKKDYADILENFDWSRANDVLSYYNVRYVTISKTYAKENVIKLEEKFIQNHIQYTNRYEDEYLIAYEIKQNVPVGFYATLGGENYSDSFNDEGRLFRVVGDGALLKITNMDKDLQSVKIIVDAKNSNVPLRLSINGQTEKITLDNSLKQYIFQANLAPGSNIIKFSVTDAEGKPVTMSNSKKKIRSGIMVSDIQIVNK